MFSPPCSLTRPRFMVPLFGSRLFLKSLFGLKSITQSYPGFQLSMLSQNLTYPVLVPAPASLARLSSTPVTLLLPLIHGAPFPKSTRLCDAILVEVFTTFMRSARPSHLQFLRLPTPRQKLARPQNPKSTVAFPVGFIMISTQSARILSKRKPALSQPQCWKLAWRNLTLRLLGASLVER